MSASTTAAPIRAFVRDGRSVRFAGYAAVFDRVDRGGDVVRPGAFRRAVAQGAAGVPLLWQHAPDKPIGRIESIAEDRRGLRVTGRISTRTGLAREAAALLREGALSGLSFGYRVRGARAGTARELTDLDLVEVSLVTFPMQPLARVHAVAEAGTTEPNASLEEALSAAQHLLGRSGDEVDAHVRHSRR